MPVAVSVGYGVGDKESVGINVPVASEPGLEVASGLNDFDIPRNKTAIAMIPIAIAAIITGFACLTGLDWGALVDFGARVVTFASRS